MESNYKKLFLTLFKAKDELELEEVIKENIEIFKDSNWKPLGGNKSNYGIVKNQQSNPIAALIEKVTNSVDALLTKKCLESGISPDSEEAPKSMGNAIERFYPKNNWDVQSFARKQAEEIQIIADSKGPYPNRNGYKTSLLIYDNGEGQHPKDFESTFLSLVRGNKNKVHFVQGKYNMGGSGAIVFCGKKRYQLIASKRFDNTGEFGFTLIREHPKRESDQAKETWYEYLVLDDKIPSFKIDTLDLGLKNRMFKTGSVIKLYSYQLGRGYSSAISHDLNQSINEFLFKPALPVLTADSEERYPNDKVLVNDLFGLKRRLEKEKDKYISDSFSRVFKDDLFGEMKVSCFVFNLKVGSFDLKKSKAEIQRRYFKNNMSVMFSMNGQVHGSYTSEFITRSLKLNLLKNHLLIHVDCTNMKYEFRKELFMASRDRLKEGDETRDLRRYLASKLSDKDGRLSEIQKLRKQAVNIDTSTNTNQLIKNFTKSLPLNSDLMKLLGDTFKLDLKKENKKDNKDKKKNKLKEESLPFSPKRFPSFFKINSKAKGDTEVAKIPLNGEKAIRFSSDCEDSYFDRVEEPGELKIAILTVKSNVSEGGDKKGEPKDIEEVFNVNTSSPNKGTIKINLNPKKDKINIGDSVQMKVSLTAPGGDFEEFFWVKVSEPEKPKEKVPQKDGDEEPLGLPQMIFAYEKPSEDLPNAVSWEGVEEATGLDVDIKTVMIPEAEGSTLKRVFINMDSSVLMNFKSKYRNPNEEQIELANRKYYTSVYFHTLFLYTITKNKGYEIKQKVEGNENLEDVDVGQYLKDLFDNYYSTFILNFGGMEEMMLNLGD